MSRQFPIFFIWIFFYELSIITGQQGQGEAISLTPLYHFHPLHRNIDISPVITAELTSAHRKWLESSLEHLVSEHKWLTPKLRVLHPT